MDDGKSLPTSAEGCTPRAKKLYGRECPGKWIALDTVWFAVATILAAYDVRKAKDAEGHEIEPDLEFTSSMLRYAKRLPRWNFVDSLGVMHLCPLVDQNLSFAPSRRGQSGSPTGYGRQATTSFPIWTLMSTKLWPFPSP